MKTTCCLSFHYYLNILWTKCISWYIYLAVASVALQSPLWEAGARQQQQQQQQRGTGQPPTPPCCHLLRTLTLRPRSSRPHFRCSWTNSPWYSRLLLLADREFKNYLLTHQGLWKTHQGVAKKLQSLLAKTAILVHKICELLMWKKSLCSRWS